jgi:sigma-B regulation protein RsbU (phosphoserine phosphatase)
MNDIINRYRELSLFDGDAAAALRVLHRHLAPDFPDCSLALLGADENVVGTCRLHGLIDPDGHEQIANVETGNEHPDLPSFSDALAARLYDANIVQRVDLAPSERREPLAAALLEPATLLAIRMVGAEQQFFWLVLGSQAEQRFATTDLRQAMLVVNLAASLIARPLLTRSLRAQAERQRLELESLAEIQRLLLPDEPHIRGLDYAIHWQPADTAAGDFYDFSVLTPDNADTEHAADHWGCLLADVSGHGAAAAMEAVQFDAILRTYPDGGAQSPAAVLTYANRHFFSRRQRQHFLTALGLLYNPDKRCLLYVNAGHPQPLRRRGNDVETIAGSEQIPLGVLRDHTWTDQPIDVAAGDLFVLYTDGIVEARSRDGQPFGVERLRALIREGSDDPRTLLSELIGAVTGHQGSSIGHDDQTLIVLRVH